VKIDIPWINNVVRDRINHGKDPGFDDLLVDGLLPDEDGLGTPPGSGSSGTSRRPRNWVVRRPRCRTTSRRWVPSVNSWTPSSVSTPDAVPDLRADDARRLAAARTSSVTDPDRRVVLYRTCTRTTCTLPGVRQRYASPSRLAARWSSRSWAGPAVRRFPRG